MFVLLCPSVCVRYVGCWHVPVLGGPAFALVLPKKSCPNKEKRKPKCANCTVEQSLGRVIDKAQCIEFDF